ncbi:translation initiation factor IF-2 [Candidatus Peregrinibacteria bacterium]|nr:translation initiation factor IF-2 [Candidatus Peregrinibacteria bacterium]
MRLVQVAKALGMTGQELRKELSQVNFGVKPTDREVPDALAKGVIRALAAKHGITVNMESLDLSEDEEADETGPEEVMEAPKTDAPAAAPQLSPSSDPQRISGDSLNVLRKLSLTDVPKAAIARQEQQMKKLTKEEREEQQREQKILMHPRKQEATNVQEQIKRKEGMVMLPEAISVKELAEKTGIQVPRIIQALMKNGVMATITQSIDYETAAIAAAELGVQVEKELRSARAEDLLSRNLEELLKDEPENLVPRPPIVVVMGHVDHGKTAILDAIRHTNVVSQEAGGITQHIGAYQVERGRPSTGSGDEGVNKITFLDTPGHLAFTAMRARGAQVTDIVVLVVSAEEGVKETTIEAIDHAKDAEVPIIVALNKIDKERADPDRVKGELAAHGLQPEEWGGTVPVVPCSALTGHGIPELLDHLLLVAELQELKANPKRSAVATVIESHLDSSLGPLATVVVNAGTLRIGDICVCGVTMGKVRALMDASGKRLTEVPPSGAARVSGLAAAPSVGDIVQVVSSEKEAKALLSSFQEHAGREQKRSFRDLVSRLTEGKLKQLKVVLKTDTQGSLEAIQHALQTQARDSTVSVKIIHGAIGAVSESDVMMASASDGVVFAFHASVSADVRRTAEREGVKIREYAIVYELLDEVNRLLKGLVEPEEEEKVLGHLDVKGVFLRKKSEQIIGGRVSDGLLKRVPFRLQRGGTVIGAGRILSLKHVDKDLREAKEGGECGLKVEIAVPVEEGDVIEAYVRELKRKEGT